MFGFVASCGGDGSASEDSLLPAGTPVVLLTIDTLRYDHVGAAGHVRDTTPALDRLAREGVFFERCFAQASWTLPSMLSLFSSLSPPVFGIKEGIAEVHRPRGKQGGATSVDLEYFAEEHVTLTEVLRERGYATAGFSTNGHLMRRHGFAQGFEHFDETSCMWGDAPDVLKLAAAWMEARKDSNVFLWVHLFDPHFDRTGEPPVYEAPAGYGELFAVPAQEAEALAPEDATRLAYDRKIRAMDDAIGAFFQRLRAGGVYDDALLAVAVDHGEEFNEEGRWGHSRAVRSTLVHVPMWIRLPSGRLAGLRVSEPVRNLDLAPTLLDLLGIAAPAAMEGQSLEALLLGEDAAVPGSAYGETRRFGLDMRFWVDAASGRKLDLDLASGERQLYALPGEPGSGRDLSAEEPERAAAMEQALRRAIAEMDARRTHVQRRGEVTNAELEELRDLGYTE